MVRFEVYAEPLGVLLYDYRFIQSYLVAFAPIPSILLVQLQDQTFTLDNIESSTRLLLRSAELFNPNIEFWQFQILNSPNQKDED